MESACVHKKWQQVCVVPSLVQIHRVNLTREEIQIQQVIHIDFDRLADLIEEEVMSELTSNELEVPQTIEIDYQRLSDLFNEMFWRGVSNPQSGDLDDCNNQIYDL